MADDKVEIERLNAIVGRLHRRINQIAEMEAEDAVTRKYNGVVAGGWFSEEKLTNIERTAEILDEIAKLLGLPPVT